MTARRLRRKARFPGRLELPKAPESGGLERLRRAMAGAGRGSALDEIEARQRAELAAREPGRPHFALRISVVAVAVAVAFGVLAVRLWSIQVIQTSTYRTGAIQTTTRLVPTAAPRGRILARGGEVLAGDTPELVVTLKTSIDTSTTPATRVASTQTEQNLVALIPGLTLAKIRSELNNEQYGPYTPVPVAEGISPGAAATIEEDPGAFPDVSVTDQYVRDYPQGDLAAQMIGYLGPFTCTGNAKPGSAACENQLAHHLAEGYQVTDLVGASGLEQQYESVLRGRDGTNQLIVDPAGNQVGTESTTPPTQGDNLVLNLDLPLEKVLSNAIASQMTCLRAGCDAGNPPVPADWGAGVCLNADTGAVLAIASIPSYNDNEWVGGISDADYNALRHEEGAPLNDYALAGDQPPGSTFKIATATAALDDGLVTPSSIIDDTGQFDQYGLSLHDADDESFGPIDITTAISASSDVFFYTLGAWFWLDRAKYGETPIQDMAAKYGLGQPSGIDLPGESYGWVDSPKIRQELHEMAPADYPASSEQWYLGDNVEMAFGQGATVVTPLEIAEAYGAFANGGTRYAPEMAAAVVSPSGKVLRRIAPKAMAHVPLPASTYDAMLAGFEGAVQNSIGTAYQDFTGFNFDKWLMAGKTGTADVAPGSLKQPTAWFVGFGGPRDSSTRYVCSVEIDQAGYGADAAAPAVRQVFNYLYAHGVGPVDLGSGH